MRTKINETENNTVERIKSPGWYFEKNIKFNKPLV